MKLTVDGFTRRAILCLSVALGLAQHLLLRFPGSVMAMICLAVCVVGIVAALLRCLTILRPFRLRATPSAIALGVLCALSLYSLLHTLPAALAWGIILAAMPLLTLLFALLEMFLAAFSDAMIGPSDRRHVLRAGLFGACFYLVFLLLLWQIGRYPVYQYEDSINQWLQIHGELSYCDIHSIGHTIYLKLLLGLWDTYDAVVLFQFALLSAMMGLFSAHLARRGVGLWAIALALSAFLFPSIVANLYTSSLKDVPYALALGFMTLLILRWLDEPDSFNGPGMWRAFALGLALAAAYVLRKNGVVLLILLGGFFALCFAARKMLAQLALLIAGCALLIIGVNSYGYGVLKASSPANGFGLQVFGSGIAAVVNEGDPSPEELAEIDAVLPVDWMRENYDPWDGTTLLWRFAPDHPDWDRDMQVFNNHYVLRMGENQGEVLRLYLRLLPRHPWVMARSVLRGTWSVWGVNHLAFIGLLMAAFFARRHQSGARAIGRRRFGALLALMPILLNALSIAISATTNEIRYLLPTYMLMGPMMLYLLCPPPGDGPATDAVLPNS